MNPPTSLILIWLDCSQPLASRRANRSPYARMKAILTDAVAVANGFARENLFASRDSQAKIYADRQWLTPLVGGSYQF
jgi:hypothetical protein